MKAFTLTYALFLGGACPSCSSIDSNADGGASSTGTGLTVDWQKRRQQRVVNDLVEASRRLGPAFTREAIQAGVHSLEQLLPGLQIDVEAMKASEWTHYPRADLPRIIQKQPQLLLQDIAEMEDNAKQVKQLLADARDPDALLTVLPSLMDPRTLISVLVTVKKWYFNKRDPVEVLEADPELILRAQDCDIPFEPVYLEGGGNGEKTWMAPSLNYHEKRAPWQQYIDQNIYKQE
eukprot:gene3512-3782_t